MCGTARAQPAATLDRYRPAPLPEDGFALSGAHVSPHLALSAQLHLEYANDPLVLLASDGPLNEQKGASDAASWLPPNKAYRCQYVARQVGIKRVWAGLRPGTEDELPILGPAPGIEGYSNATGAFRTGIVASPMTGRLVAQSVLGEPTDMPIEPFLVERFGTPELARTS